MEEMLIAMNNI